jgi:hypothetical protein
MAARLGASRAILPCCSAFVTRRWQTGEGQARARHSDQVQSAIGGLCKKQNVRGVKALPRSDILIRPCLPAPCCNLN